MIVDAPEHGAPGRQLSSDPSGTCTLTARNAPALGVMSGRSWHATMLCRFATVHASAEFTKVRASGSVPLKSNRSSSPTTSRAQRSV